MATVRVGAGNTSTINQSGTDDVAFDGLGTLNVAGTTMMPIDVTLSSVAGVGVADTINITNANVTLAGQAAGNVLTQYNIGSGGTLTLASGAQLTVGSTVNFTSPNAHLMVNNGTSVSGLSGVSGFQPGDTIDFPAGTTSVSYTDNPGSNTGGQLTGMDANGMPTGSVTFLNGDYTGASFGSGSNAAGGVSAGLAATQPLYRFFDSGTGTQFLTASQSEKTALSTPGTSTYRPDLVPETNNFGAADPTSADPAKLQVFRFFDTRFGTHFFTSSQAEATGLSTPASSTYRADLVAEPTATFYEHSRQESGDVAVYRLFDSVHGTHFYTGSATELAGLTTAGTSTYRPDLVNESVSFYAPSGSYT